MRHNIRIKFGNVTFFAMLSHTQTLEGITSKIDKDKHIILWDIEKCNLKDAKKTLSKVQRKHKLGDIEIISDAPQSFRGWCFSQRPWKEYLIILLETDYLDYNFFYWTVRRGSATLRKTNKQGREPQTLVDVLEGYEKTSIPKKLTHVIYDTGVEKRGKIFNLRFGGEEDG
jgi:hypothetical protein